MSDGTPVFVRMCKKDAIADDGKQVWVLSVQIDWMQQNLKLINNVIHSAMWRFDCDKSGNIKNSTKNKNKYNIFPNRPRSVLES